MSKPIVFENLEKAGHPRTERAELQWLGDPKNKPLLNAENLTVTEDGRLFVTGSERVCEITPDGTGGYVWTDIPLPESLSKPMFRNGIASDGRHLYLACAEVDQNAQPFLTGWLPQLTKRPQDALGFTLLLLAETLCPVRSYVLRADLSVKPLRFGDHVALAGKCFANGLAVDKNGNVYVASGSGIHRVPAEAWTAPSKDPIKLWHRTDPPVPNGIKATDKKLFFTRLGQPPLLCWQKSVLYDDFDVEDDGGFVVTVVSDFTNVLGAFAGELMFFDADGTRRGEFRDSRIKHPSAVVVLRRDTPFGAKGDLLLTEKESHTVWRLHLDRPWVALTVR
jgi:hypothetical protein